MTADNILVLDIETTGLDGIQKGDKILSIGIVTVNVNNKTVMPTFYAPIYQELEPKDREAWIFRKKHMDVSEITGAPWDEWLVARLVARMIDGMMVTTYNTAFDLDKFLDPWLDAVFQDDAPFYFRAPCLMRASAQVPEIPRTMHEDGSCWPSLKSTYYQICEERQAGIRTHHALNDAIIAGQVMLALMERGLYDPHSTEEYQ